MFSALTEEGRLGLTAVADTPEAARSMYDRAGDLIVREGERALNQAPVV
jgi:hypothetical protein